MPQTCSVCRHPERESIEDLLLRNTLSLRIVAGRTGVSAWALHRHKRHVAFEVVKAIQITGADSLLSRVEGILAEVKEIAKAAKKQKDWPAATAAFREMRGCLELLGKVTGELQPQQGGSLHLHRHTHVVRPKSEADVDIDIAWHVATATNNFDPGEIARLRALTAVNNVPPKQQCPQAIDSESS
ncbi:MAG TPA: hypothetical protein VN948_15030 [Terriglobales bacterium]|nr:hypothetical protein [Terriglobales bacterium]